MNENRLLDLFKDPKRILIVKLSSLGDIVQSLPVVALLHEKYPVAEITWIANSKYIELLELVPDINKVIPFERTRWGKALRFYKTLKEFIGFIRNIRRQHFDLVLDLQGLFRSGLITFLSRAPNRIGFAEAREGAFLFYNHKIEVPSKKINAVERYLRLAKYLGCEPMGLYKEPVFNINPVFERLFKQDQSYIAINPGGRWLTKHWPVQRFVQLIDKLQKRYGIKMVLVGDENDKSIAADIVSQAKIPVTDLTGKTNLRQLTSLLGGCKLLITNDSGPMHLAGALGKPVVALFGPTDSLLTGPWGKRHRILQSKVWCSPCFKRKCKDIKCMESISVTEVFGAVEDITV